MAEIRRRSVTHGEMVEQGDALLKHLDQRIKDTERVLTWRMIAVNSVAVTISGLTAALVKGADEPVVRTVAQALRVLW